MTFIATLTLSQTGREGPVTAEVDYEGDHEQGAESHICMQNLEDLWGEMRDHMGTADVAGDDQEYSATLTLSQKDVGGDVYTKLEMFPKLSSKDTGIIPTSYEAICFLAQVWLQMAGIIDDDGNVLDEEAVEKSMELGVTQSPTVH